MSQKTFLTRIQEMHKDNPYVLDDIEYIDLKKDIVVICKVHGSFIINAEIFAKGGGCSLCKIEVRKNTFIEKASSVHKDKYDYSKINYITNKLAVEIICPEHGSFFQVPGEHLKGYGCSRCSQKNKPTTEEWVDLAKKVHGDKYDYSLVEYVTNKTPIKVICPEHGVFNPLPGNHLFKKTECPLCNDQEKSTRFTKTIGEFIINARIKHGNLYDYSKSIYVNKATPLEIICNKHGSFMQAPQSHLSGRGCSKCILKNQNRVFTKLTEKFPELELRWEARLDWLKGQRFDIYIPDINLAVEYNGQQHYKSIEHMGGVSKFKLVQERDSLKREKCLKNNCELFELKYDYKEEDMKALLSRIEELLNK
jgi:hypothetical protein